MCAIDQKEEFSINIGFNSCSIHLSFNIKSHTGLPPFFIVWIYLKDHIVPSQEKKTNFLPSPSEDIQL